ncbi:MAG: hypothetical protein V1731_02685 [Candidatus Aenigmatarchaeota archaeon]
MLKKFLLVPAVAAVISGAVSAGLFIYFVLQAISPGTLATAAIFLAGILLGVFVAVGVGAVATLVQVRNSIVKMSQKTCAACAEKLPENASFCPFCGCRADLAIPLILGRF